MAPVDARTLDTIFKAYDVRGTVPDQLDEAARRAHRRRLRPLRGDEARPRDATGDACSSATTCGPPASSFADAFARGVTSQGLDVVDLGLASTDLVYFAAGHFDAPGAMLTASHNPAQYNGIKLCLAGARPVGEDTGLCRDPRPTPSPGVDPVAARRARSPSATCSPTFAAHVHSFVDVDRADAARRSWPTPPTAWAASSRRRCSRACRSTSRSSTASSTAPSRTIRPTRSSPRTCVDLQARVLETGADVGLAFDGDADRVFLVDDQGAAGVGLARPRPSWPRHARQAPGRDDPAQPHLLEGRARGHPRARAARRCAPGSATRSSSR